MRILWDILAVCALLVIAFLAGAGWSHETYKNKLQECIENHKCTHTITTDGAGENADTWVAVGDLNWGAQWRQLTYKPEDSMAVVHIWQDGQVSTWIGKPCNCY